jgi:hypothetical protein
VSSKLLLFSVVIVSVIIPVWAARDTSARRGLRKAVLLVAAFNLLYLVALKYLYWRLL